MTTGRVGRRRLLVLAVGLLLLAASAVTAGSVLGPGAHSGSGQGGATPAGGTALTTAPHVDGAAVTPRPIPAEIVGPAAVPSFNLSARSIDDPSSIWVVVNKKRPLAPADYVPPDLVAVPVPSVWDPQLRQEASVAAADMFAAFERETGLRMQSQSAYRSYETQVRVYNDDVAANGQAFADTSTARPGSSEHQTGLAIDVSALPPVCSLAACFGDTPQGQWLAGNAWRFGYLLRYPADKAPITGYDYEPWHYRYIGVDLAEEMHDIGSTTLEEFFGLPAAPAY